MKSAKQKVVDLLQPAARTMAGYTLRPGKGVAKVRALVPKLSLSREFLVLYCQN